MDKRRLAVVLTVALILSGCTFEPTIVAANYSSVGDNYVVRIFLPSNDAAVIKARQLYFSIVLVECGDGSARYPAEPFSGGEEVSAFRFPVSGETVEFTADVPSLIVDQYRHPCVFIEGGGYLLSGTLRSELMPLSILGNR